MIDMDACGLHSRIHGFIDQLYTRESLLQEISAPDQKP